ncbi:hypothetical protein E8E15_003733 [Penicillium rubens]|jgi:hypothetical protein|uniref:uncharacterized protein n=1 Tax=Penicillium rubens TaxID=1108849 RepID=UPI001D96E461|nr:uncharacterized protein N7525_002191 [Penicillium rubens]KAF3019918.1 hypothetical protein E8E15_003733 [Penicillium rubens]KAJ5033898.1 hypothetical protein NUH16_005316 [Penicillium rubens]KAJ5844450.1 hypothetical protein N7525_002191 [Penicillium rubens]
MSPSNKYFYRCFSEKSAGGLTCGLKRIGPRLSKPDLSLHFKHHKDRHNTYRPTALVSVTDRPIEALHRAFVKHYNGGEVPSTIWVAIISVPATTDAEKLYHHAQQLADADIKFKHEYLFEWQIPDQYVEHIISVKTLLSRGLDLKEYLDHGDDKRSLPKLSTFISRVAEGISNDSIDGYDFGRNLADIAQCFGARAPVLEIAWQILYDCPPYFSVMTEDGSEKWQPYTKDFSWILDGIDEGIVDFWLTDSTFILDHRNFVEWSESMRNEVKWMWVDYIVDLYHDICAGTNTDYVYKEEQRLKEYEENIEIEIEEEAVAIGL